MYYVLLYMYVWILNIILSKWFYMFCCVVLKNVLNLFLKYEVIVNLKKCIVFNFLYRVLYYFEYILELYMLE